MGLSNYPASGWPTAPLRTLIVAVLATVLMATVLVPAAAANVVSHQISVSGNPASVGTNEIIEYVLDVSCSTTTAPDCGVITVSDPLPTGVDFIDAGTVGAPGFEANYDAPSRTVSFARPDGAAVQGGQSIQMTVSVRVRADHNPAFPIENTSQVTSSDPSFDASSNTVSLPVVNSPQWVVTKTQAAPEGAPALDSPVTYVVTVCGPTAGNVALPSGLQLVDTYPAGASVVDADGGAVDTGLNTITWDVPEVTQQDLAAATDDEYCFEVAPRISYNAADGFAIGNSVTNAGALIVAASGQIATPYCLNGAPDCQRQVVGTLSESVVDLGGRKTAPESISENGILIYSLRYHTEGSNVAVAGAAIEDVLPEMLELRSIVIESDAEVAQSPAADVFISEDGGATWVLLDTIAANTSGRTTFEYRAMDQALAGPASVVNAVRIEFRDAAGAAQMDPGLSMRISLSTGQHPDVPMQVGETITNCALLDSADGGVERCVDVAVTEPLAVFGVSKETPETTTPGDTHQVGLGFMVFANNGLPVVDPVIEDLLPAEFVFDSYVGKEDPRTVTPGPPEPNIEIIDNYQGTGRQLVRFFWSDTPPATATGIDGISPAVPNSWAFDWTADVQRATRRYGRRILGVGFLAKPRAGTIPEFYDNTASVTSASPAVWYCHGSGDEVADSGVGCSASSTVEVLAAAALSGTKWDRGIPELGLVDSTADPVVLSQLCPTYLGDDEFTRYPCAAQTVPSGQFNYKLEFVNEGNIPLNDYWLYDILPYVGDVGVNQALATTPRNSAWAANLGGPIEVGALPAGNTAVTVEYSTSTNPCRSEMSNAGPPTSWPSGCTDDWTATPADWSAVRAFRINVPFEAGFPPGEAVIVDVPMIVPNDAPFDAIAWNSFAHVATNAISGDRLLPSAPPIVGIRVPGEDDIDPNLLAWDLALTNVINPNASSDLVDGIDPGDAVTFDLTVTNQAKPVTQVSLVNYVDVSNFAFGTNPPSSVTASDGTTWDYTWDTSDVEPMVTLTSSGATLDSGETVTVPITLNVLTDWLGQPLEHWAEIADFDDDTTSPGTGAGGELPEADSTPDSDQANDNQPTGAGDPGDNYIDGDGEPGGADPELNDEDDHDVAAVPIWDLSLINERGANQSFNVDGATRLAAWSITVKNQGDQAAYDIAVQNEIAAGMAFSSFSGVVAGDAVATTPATAGNTGTINFVVDALAPGEAVTFEFVTSITDTSLAEFLNQAEIASFDGDDDDTNDALVLAVDADSTPDASFGNDAVLTAVGTDPNGNDDRNSHNDIDRDTDSDGNLNERDGTDEDDHDQELVVLGFDLALRENFGETSATPLVPGTSTVSFDIEVINQGRDVETVSIADYIDDELFEQFDALLNPSTTVTDDGDLDDFVVTWDSTDPLVPLATLVPANAGGTFANGETLTVTITLTVASAWNGAVLENWSEITNFDDDTTVAGDAASLDLVDEDSQPDSVQLNDNQPTGPGAPGDNHIGGDGDPAGADPLLNDEDDHDVAAVPVWDLALIASLGAAQDFVVDAQDATVAWSVTVKNQGREPAFLIDIADQLPAGTSWQSFTGVVDGDAVVTTDAIEDDTGTVAFEIDELAVAESVTFEFVTSIDDVELGEYLNQAEVVGFDDDADATNTPNPAAVDIDSISDASFGNDAVLTDTDIDPNGNDDRNSHNNVDYDADGDGNLNEPSPTDEDDHGQELAITVFDLALTEQFGETSVAPLEPGVSTVTFLITITNQGRPVRSVTVTDYIDPDLFELFDVGDNGPITVADSGNGDDFTINWSGDGTVAPTAVAATASGELAPGETLTIPVTLTINSDWDGTALENWSEISNFDDDPAVAGDAVSGAIEDVDSTPNQDQSDDNQPTGPDAPGDNEIDGDGDGADAILDDEDDHDVAGVPVWDLALIVELGDSQTFEILPTDTEVTWSVTVENQGNQNVFDIDVRNELPADMEWLRLDGVVAGTAAVVTSAAANSTDPVFVTIDRLVPGETVTFEFTTAIADSATATEFVNVAEVSSFDDDADPLNAPNASAVDIDSVPDSIPTNDAIETSEDIDPAGNDDRNSHNNTQFDADQDTNLNEPSLLDEDDHGQEVVRVRPLYRLGNLVWFDLDDNGVADDGEPGVGGLDIELWQAGGTEALRTTTTDVDGTYAFADLENGDYYVVVPGGQTDLTIGSETASLADLRSGASVVSDPDIAGDEDNDNNGSASGAGYSTGIISLGEPDELVPSEPTDEVQRSNGAPALIDDDDDDVADDRSNYTLDIGLAQDLRIGNLVWLDNGGGFGNPGYVQANDDNGAADSGESGIAGVLVQLLDDNDDVIAETVTTADGNYWFNDVDPGTYRIAIPVDQQPDLGASGVIDGAIDGLISSTATAADPSNLDDDDDGDGETAWLAISASFDVAFGDAPTSEEGDLGDDTVGAAETAANLANGFVANSNSNLQIDLGLIDVPLYRIGNLVWEDYDNDGVADEGEPGLAGVLVQLLDDGVVVEETVTDNAGHYSFTNLVAGDYQLRIPLDQQPLLGEQPDIANGVMDGLETSGTPTTDPDASGDSDHDNDGVSGVLGYTSGVLTLGEGDKHAEAENETSRDGTTDSDEDDALRDNRSNLTVDFGFFRGLRLGNQVFLDGEQGDTTHNNGLFDVGETGIGGVTVELWIDDGSGELDPDVDEFVTSTATDTEGNYYFGGLEPGVSYLVAIVEIPVNEPGELSSTGISVSPTSADGDDDGTPIDGYASVSAPIVLAIGESTTAESDAEPTGDGLAEDEANIGGDFYPDGNSELSIDFGFVDVPLYRIGDLVWNDLDHDGLAETGEPGLSGVLVQLLNGDGLLVAETATDDAGRYVFENLAAGNYQVRLPGDQTPVGAAPDGYDSAALDGFQSSTNGEQTEAANDVDHDDNGILTAGDQLSGVVVLGETGSPSPFGDEPDGETTRSDNNESAETDFGSALFPDTVSNLTVDFGFYQLALGNQVWLDINDDGLISAGEPGIDNVEVQLFDTSDADPELVATTVTANGGLYRFDGLIEGVPYVVVIPASAFADGAPLEGLYSSTDPVTGTVDPDGDEATPGAGIDSDDNGADPTLSVGTVVSLPVVLAVSDEPAGEAPGSGEDIADTSENLTVDFGFHRGLRIGSIVWFDDGSLTVDDENGTADPAESGIEGVTLTLWADTGSAPGEWDSADVELATATTDTLGRYEFGNLDEGNYLVVIAESEYLAADAPLFDQVPTRPASDSDQNNDSDGTTVPGLGVVSGPITLALGQEPTDEGLDGPNATADEDEQYADANSDLTVDFGFIDTPLYRIGNLVWEDLDGDGTADEGEPGIAGVLVQLLDETGVVVAETVTAADGNYVFEDLLAGEFRVRIPISQTPEVSLDLEPDVEALAGLRSSQRGEESDADGDVDNDDNGLGQGDWVSGTVELGEDIFDGEPTNEVNRALSLVDDDLDGPTGWPDGRSNLSVDFGFYGLTLGNRVWLDTNDNGVVDADEAGIADVTVELYQSAAGQLDLVDSVVTDADGYYLFTGLAELTEYVVSIPTSQFEAGAALHNLYSSTDPDSGPVDVDGDEAQAGDGIDNDDNGVDPQAYPGAVTTLPVVLAPTDEPVAEQADFGTARPDANQNFTADFGFHRGLRIGTLVWIDDGNQTFDDENGLADSSELGVAQVPVQLWLDRDGSGDFDISADRELGSQLTGDDGRAEFGHLQPGTYFLVVPDSAFDEAGPLFERVSTFDGVDDDITNNDDNGKLVAGAGVVSTAVVLAPGGEPIDEGVNGTNEAIEEDGLYGDSNSNWAPDFGFVEKPVYRIGNLVWHDLDGDGAATADEPGITGVLVQLVDTQTGVVIAETVTDDIGHYAFENLEAGEYQVRIPTDQAPEDSSLVVDATALVEMRSSETDGLADSDIDNNDDGTILDDGSGWTSTTLVLGEAILDGEPTDETLRSDDPTDVDDDFPLGQPDARSNLSVDFGFYRLALGDTVFFDWNNSGAQDNGELGVPDVMVNLVDAATGTTVDSTTTDADGNYLFVELVDDTAYIVEIAQENFLSGGPLDGYHSSDGPSASADVTDRIDGDDNGEISPGGVQSAPVTVSANDEPIDDAGDELGVAPDNSVNLTVDFGFYTATVGNQVWLDTNDDGVRSQGEVGIEGVTVHLLDAILGIPIRTEVTSTDGTYLFTGLPEGAYIVALDEADFAADPDGSGPEQAGVLFGLASSTPPASALPTFDDDVDDGSNTTTPQTEPFVVTAGTAPPSSGGVANGLPEVPAGNQYLTVDFGLHAMTLGNRIFLDMNGNGVLDGDESGQGEVVVELWQTDDAGAIITSAPLATTQTNSEGYYVFTGLEPGTYAVSIPGDMIREGGPLFGYISTVGNGDDAPDPDVAELDRDDNGDPRLDKSAWTLPVTLVAGTEPRGEADISPDASHVHRTDDANTNLTIDLGFEPRPGIAVGNHVWLDVNGDGVKDETEPGIDGVLVELRDSDGTQLTFDVTDNGGFYLFPGLDEGDYRVAVVAENFDDPGDALWGRYPLRDDDVVPEDPDNDLDLVDDGFDPTVVFGDVVSDPVTLIDLFEPRDEALLEVNGVHVPSDPNDNLTVDFGFVEVGVGGTIFADPGEDGVHDEGDAIVPSVEVHLLTADGQPVLDGQGNALITETDDDGQYVFEGIAPGTYIVEIPASMFVEGSPLHRWAPSRGNNGDDNLAADPDDNVDRDTNGNSTGTDIFTGDAVRTTPVDLEPNEEPLDDGETTLADANANLTVDFGFFDVPLHELGGVVWFDQDNDGVRSETESVAPPGVELGLLDADGEPVLDDTNEPITTQTLDDGVYIFTALPEGDYSVVLSGHNLQNDGALDDHWPSTGDGGSEDPNDDAMDRNDGVATEGLSMQTGVVTLYPESEPTGEFVGAVPDSHSNITVDFGIYQLVVVDVVRFDRNADGEFGEDDHIGSGVIVRLLNEDEEEVVDTNGDPIEGVTNDDGVFEFPGIPEGTYVIAVPSENFEPDGPLVGLEVDLGWKFVTGLGFVSEPFATEGGDDIEAPPLRVTEPDIPELLAYSGSQSMHLALLGLVLVVVGLLASGIGYSRRRQFGDAI